LRKTTATFIDLVKSAPKMIDSVYKNKLPGNVRKRTENRNGTTE